MCQLACEIVGETWMECGSDNNGVFVWSECPSTWDRCDDVIHSFCFCVGDNEFDN